MLKGRAIGIFSMAFMGIFLNSCSNSGSAPGGSSINIPQVTKPVVGATASSLIRTAATSGQLLNSHSCSGCGAKLSQVWSMASIFVLQGKVADLNSCIIQALANSGAVSGLTSGSYNYLTTTDSKIKVSVTLDGSDIKSFELFGCDATSQNQYLSGTKSGSDVTFTGRNSASSVFVTMDATGTMTDGTWSSKSLTVGQYSTSGPTYSQFTMKQGSDYLDISGVLDQGTLGTLDSTDVTFYSRAQLIGDSATTYALGDGAVQLATGTAASSTTNWNGDTKAEGSGPTTYDSIVSAATLPTVPTTRATGFATSEQWDCSVSGTPVDVEEMGMSNPTLMTTLSACIEGFQ